MSFSIAAVGASSPAGPAVCRMTFQCPQVLNRLHFLHTDVQSGAQHGDLHLLALQRWHSSTWGRRRLPVLLFCYHRESVIV
jgi:hypothetical protein